MESDVGNSLVRLLESEFGDPSPQPSANTAERELLGSEFGDPSTLPSANTAEREEEEEITNDIGATSLVISQCVLEPLTCLLEPPTQSENPITTQSANPITSDLLSYLSARHRREREQSTSLSPTLQPESHVKGSTPTLDAQFKFKEFVIFDYNLRKQIGNTTPEKNLVRGVSSHPT